MVDTLRRAGLVAELVETEGHPLALGSWNDAGPDAPTLLIYGHYDVQPPEPLELWSSPPFEPEVRDGRIYARGATDNKGQLFVHLKALELLLQRDGRLPVNVLVLAEGEEEVASPNLLPVVEARREELRADGLLISDSAMFAEGLPSLLLSLRGLAYFEIRVRGARADLHSGIYGGAVPNAGTILAKILSTLHDDEGGIAIEGFYDSVVEWDEDIRQRIRELPFQDETFAREAGVQRLEGESGFGTLERLWLRPTCDVNGIECGYTGEGAKTVLPATATAKVSFRLVPDQDPSDIDRLFREHVRRISPTGVDVEVIALHGGRPWRADPRGPFFEAARRSLRATFGAEPVLTGEGASIPIVAELEEISGARAVLVGLALPGANMHAPDEWFPEDHVEKGIEMLARLYEELPSLL